MAEVLRRTLVAATRPPSRGVALRVGLRTVSVSPADVERVLAAAHESTAPYRERRDRFAVLLADRVLALASGGGAFGDEARELMRGLSSDGAFRALLDRVWPTVRPTDLIRGLFQDSAGLASAANGLLSSDEARTLSSSVVGERWTASDAALIDEAQALIAGPPRTYGHVIVDEAQDLSPMQLRMIARRAPSGSITVLGDVAQATGLWPHTRWEEVLAHLPGGKDARIEELTIGYRVPKPILDLAAKLLPLIAPDLKAPLAIREGAEPEFVKVEEGEMIRALLKEMEEAQSRRGTLGVIVPVPMLDDLLVAARGQRVEVDAADWGRGWKITVLTPRQAKGLEFDHVVVAEPADIAGNGRDGYRQIYVSLTRSTQSLKVLHAHALPTELVVTARLA